MCIHTYECPLYIHTHSHTRIYASPCWDPIYMYIICYIDIWYIYIHKYICIIYTHIMCLHTHECPFNTHTHTHTHTNLCESMLRSCMRQECRTSHIWWDAFYARHETYSVHDTRHILYLFTQIHEARDAFCARHDTHSSVWLWVCAYVTGSVRHSRTRDAFYARHTARILYMYTNTHIQIQTHIQIHTHYMCIHIYIHIYALVYTYIFTCTYIYLHVHIYIYMYICRYIHI